MIWIIASMPLWFLGAMLFILGAAAANNAIKAADGAAALTGLAMVGLSAPTLYMAARLIA